MDEHQLLRQNEKNNPNADEDVFRRATQRTFRGFEKDDQSTIWKGPFSFIQAADPQFGLIDEFAKVNWDGPTEVALIESAKYKAAGASVWEEEMRLSSLAISQWNHLTPVPRFVVICGDLVNDYPGGLQRSDQLVDFKATFRQLDHRIPLVLLPGNHDLLNRPTEESVEEYRRSFGDDYFSFWVDGVLFLVLNVQYFKDKSLVKELAEEHERWIDEQLEEIQKEKNQYKHVIVFQHIPWFLRDIDEPDDEMYNIAVADRRRMIEKFSQAGIRAIFAGHYHRNAGGKFEDMELVVTSALGAQNTGGGLPADKSGYRIVQVLEDCIQHRFIEIEQERPH